MTDGSRRRYVPLAERADSRAPERLVINGQLGTVVGTETAYVVRLESGQYVVLSQNDHRAAVEAGRADAEAVRRATRERRVPARVIPGTVVQVPKT